MAFAGDGVGVAGAGGQPVEDLALAFFELAAFVVFFFAGGFAAEEGLFFFEGLAGGEGG